MYLSSVHHPHPSPELDGQSPHCRQRDCLLPETPAPAPRPMLPLQARRWAGRTAGARPALWCGLAAAWPAAPSACSTCLGASHRPLLASGHAPCHHSLPAARRRTAARAPCRGPLPPAAPLPPRAPSPLPCCLPTPMQLRHQLFKALSGSRQKAARAASLLDCNRWGGGTGGKQAVVHCTLQSGRGARIRLPHFVLSFSCNRSSNCSCELLHHSGLRRCCGEGATRHSMSWMCSDVFAAPQKPAPCAQTHQFFSHRTQPQLGRTRVQRQPPPWVPPKPGC